MCMYVPKCMYSVAHMQEPMDIRRRHQSPEQEFQVRVSQPLNAENQAQICKISKHLVFEPFLQPADFTTVKL